MKERFPPTNPFALPEELIEAIQDDEYACVTLSTTQGTALLIKAPETAIMRLQGLLPIGIRQELFDHPNAPVLRITATIQDDPEQPFLAETFINVADPDQRADYLAFADQPEIPLLFYDQDHRQQLAKSVVNGARSSISRLLQAADTLLHDIPASGFDFELAKQEIINRSSGSRF